MGTNKKIRLTAMANFIALIMFFGWFWNFITHVLVTFNGEWAGYGSTGMVFDSYLAIEPNIWQNSQK